VNEYLPAPRRARQAGWTDQSSQKQERFTLLGNSDREKGLAETIERYLSKGSQVGISGSIQQRTWQNDAGDTRSTVEIVVRNLTMLDGKRRESVPPAQDDDIPF